MMKNLFIPFALLLIIPSFLFGQSSNLYDLYDIPDYAYRSMSINSPNLYDYEESKRVGPGYDEWIVNINSELNLDRQRFHQRSEGNFESYARISTLYHYYHAKLGTSTYRKQKEVIISLLASLSQSHYLGGERGWFVHGTVAGYRQYDFEREVQLYAITIPVGVGYGRVIAVRSVAQAHVIDDELGLNLTDKKVLELARLIEKEASGYYQAEYKDDADIAFYDEIAEITGKPESTPKVRQITRSSVYKTTARYIGWQVKTGIALNSRSGSVENSSESDDQSDFFASVEYALPIGMDKQFITSARYVKPLGDAPRLYTTPYLEAFTSFTIDHKYTWSSALNLNYVLVMPDVGDNKSSLSLTASTDYAILNSFLIVGSANYDLHNTRNINVSGTNSLPIVVPIIVGLETTTSRFHLGFKYYID